jgi:hypothetical protein
LTGSFNDLFGRLIAALQSAEERRRTLRDNAYVHGDTEKFDGEIAIISDIVRWRRGLESIRSEMTASMVMTDEEASDNAITSTNPEPTRNVPATAVAYEQAIPDNEYPQDTPATRGTTPEQQSVPKTTNPTKITLLGREYSVANLSDIYVKVCEVMMLYRPYIFAAFDKDDELNTEGRTNFSYVHSEIKSNGKRLQNGLWIETDRDSSRIVSDSKKLIEKCGFSSDELLIETTEVN